MKSNIIKLTFAFTTAAFVAGCASNGVKNPSGVAVTEMKADERGFVAPMLNILAVLGLSIEGSFLAAGSFATEGLEDLGVAGSTCLLGESSFGGKARLRI